jgi:sterol 3beta-glucosyltransferase
MPFCADQFFWADVLARRGVAPPAVYPARTASQLAPALDALLSAPMAERARALGERIRKEDGPGVATALFHSALKDHRQKRSA